MVTKHPALTFGAVFESTGFGASPEGLARTAFPDIPMLVVIDPSAAVGTAKPYRIEIPYPIEICLDLGQFPGSAALTEFAHQPGLRALFAFTIIATIDTVT